MIYKKANWFILATVVNVFEGLIRVRILRQGRTTREACALMAVVSCILMAPDGFGGEKIQFSDGTQKVDLPGKILKDDLFSKPLDFLKSRGDDSGGSIIPTLPAPSSMTVLPKDILEKKNKSLNVPDDLNQDAALKQIFGVREYKFENLEKKSKRSLDEIWDGQSPRRRQGQAGINDPISRRETEQERRDRASDPSSARRDKDMSRGVDSPEQDDNSPGNGPIAELNLNNLLNPTQRSDSLNQGPYGASRPQTAPSGLGQIFNSSAVGQTGRSHEQELRTQEFQKLLKSAPLWVKQANDPVNSLPDGTRQEMNPVRGKRIDDFSGLKSSLPGADGLSSLGRAARPSPFESLNTRVLGASSLAPSISAPPLAAPPVFQPPPLEIPRRKF